MILENGDVILLQARVINDEDARLIDFEIIDDCSLNGQVSTVTVERTVANTRMCENGKALWR